MHPSAVAAAVTRLRIILCVPPVSMGVAVGREAGVVAVSATVKDLSATAGTRS